jgi:hypothetical protein
MRGKVMNFKVLKIVTGLMVGFAAVFVASKTLATVSSTTTQTSAALGNGVTTSYTIGFSFEDNDHITVYLQEESVSPYTICAPNCSSIIFFAS